MSVAWKCPKCGVVLRKGSPYLEKVLKSGGDIIGTATCANCGAKCSQYDVYSGKYDVPEPVLARQAIPEDPKAEAPELLLILIDRNPPGGTALHLQRLLSELPLHERGRSQVVQVTASFNNQFFVSQAALLQASMQGFKADLAKLTWRTYSTVDGVNGVFVKIYKSTKESAKPSVKPETKTKDEVQQRTQKSEEKKRTDIYEILMDAICCVMCADGKATSKEREAIHIIFGKTKAPWTKEDIDKRIDLFLKRAKMDGMDKIVQTTCVDLSEFKRRKKQEVLMTCLDFMARADGIADENEKKLIEKFKSAIEVGSADSADQVSPDAVTAPAKNTDEPSRQANISEKPVPQSTPVKQYRRQPRSSGCPVCGGALAKRIVPNSIKGTSTPMSWHWEVKIAEVCIKCHPQPCMVAGCTETATEVLPHKYEMGKGRARVGFRNDVFICATHLAPIKKYRFFNLLGQISTFAWMGIGLVGAIIGAAKGKTILQYWWYILFVIPCIALFFYADKWKLAKKKEYHMAGIGQYGSRWADDDFSAPLIE